MRRTIEGLVERLKDHKEAIKPLLEGEALYTLGAILATAEALAVACSYAKPEEVLGDDLLEEMMEERQPETVTVRCEYYEGTDDEIQVTREQAKALLSTFVSSTGWCVGWVEAPNGAHLYLHQEKLDDLQAFADG